MKKLIPFQKELIFKNYVHEITSISLEHNLKLKEKNQISGEFIISGTYKMTEASINVDPFEYKIPFDISIDKKYDATNIEVDINDFYYELINNETLSVNIEIIIDGLEEKEEPTVPKEKTITQNDKEIKEETREETQTIEQTANGEEITKSIFENLDENERYSVYKVHVITENDTIDSILQKYGITKETLETYNDLNDMQIGNKLIIEVNEN